MELSSQQMQQQEKLSDDQIRDLIYGRANKTFVVKSEEHAQKLEEDRKWCKRLLKRCKSLALEYPRYIDRPCKALTEAMRLNNPKYVLQELRGGWMLLDAATSLSSLQSFALELNRETDPVDLPDMLVKALETRRRSIWELGISHDLKKVDRRITEWVNALERLCNGGQLKSLISKTNSPIVFDMLIANRSRCKLEHLHLLISARYLMLNTPSKGMWWDSLRSLRVDVWAGSWDVTLFKLISNNIQHFGLALVGSSDVQSEDTDGLLLQLKGSHLRRLFLLDDAPNIILSRREDQVRFVDFLDKNADVCPLETIEGVSWVDESIQQNCIEILKRNKLYRQEGLFEDLMPPNTAKLFICGDSGVGKSTLRKNLTRSLWIPGYLQFSRSTYGIRLEALKFGDRTLVVCDLAGQPEFHTLHHYFMRGTDKDLFLVVCRAPNGKDETSTVLEEQLRYWLRFIVAHRSLSEHKPRVLILLNFFPDSKRDGEALDFRCQQVVDEYLEHINFGNHPYVSSFNFKRYSSVRGLKPKLEEALGGLIESLPNVPKLCKKIVQTMNSTKRPKVMSMAQFKSLCKGLSPKGEDMRFIKVCIMYLHDTGEVLYLEEGESKDENQQFIIVDVQWFLQDLVGQFLPRLSRNVHDADNSSRATQSLSAVSATIIRNRCSREHVEYLLFCLDRLGITLRSKDSDKVTILPLIQTTLGAWRNDSTLTVLNKDSYSFWGRRFDCKDSARRLLPFGIFNMLQVKLADIFSMTEIGKGWLYLVENRIHIIVKIGGTHGQWYDKHWVDVLVRIPFDDDPDNYLLETGDKLFRQVKTCLFHLCGAVNWGCPSLELEEKVIAPRFVEQKPGSDDFPNVHQLHTVLKKIKEQGMQYNYTWTVVLETTPAFQLFLPCERDAFFNEKRRALATVQIEVEECLGSEFLTKSKERPHSAHDQLEIIMQRILQSEYRIVKQVQESAREIISEIKRLELVIKKQLESIQLQSMNIMSKLEFHLEEFHAPRYPFLTDDSNCLEKISALAFGRRSRLHFLCEYPGGCHPVEGQKGIQIKVSPEWFKSAAPVLMPTLRILFFALKIVAIASFGVAIPSPESAFPKELQKKTIEAVCEQVFGTVDARLKTMVPSGTDLKTMVPSRTDLEDSLNELLKGRNLHEELGLWLTIQNSQPFWLCHKHKSE